MAKSVVRAANSESGEVGMAAEKDAAEKREFKAKVNIVLEKTLYPIGSFVPLTRPQFDELRKAGSIEADPDDND